LTEWTGQRWVVSLSAEEGEATLLAQDREAEAARMDRARAHPLMQAVFKAFPESKVVALRQRTVTQSAAEGDDGPEETGQDFLFNDNED